MIAEVLAIGDELTSGERLNTNSQWLSKRLAEIGIQVVYHATVSDQMAPLRDVIETAARRADVVVVTGGLGPTADDLTREAIALALGVPLVLDEPSLAHIEKMFARRGRPMPERNRIQAMFPEGTTVIPNPEGTAPGVDAVFHRVDGGACRLFALPGVPAEMFQMWEQTVRPALIAGRTVRTIRHREIKVFGAGESDVESRLPDLIQRGRVPSVGITAHQATITLRITSEADTEEECLALAEPTAKIIYDCLGKLVYGEGNDDIHHAVVRQMRQLNLTLATVEIGAAGRVASAFAESNNAGVYRGGLVLADAQQAAAWLGQPDLATVDVVSAAMAERLAVAVKQRSGADFVLAVSGYPPAPAGPTDPPKQFYVAVVSSSGTTAHEFDFSGHSAIIHARATKQAINALRLDLP